MIGDSLFVFETNSVLTNTPLGELDPFAYKWNSPVWGAAECEISLAYQLASVEATKRRTATGTSALYVTHRESGICLFGGPIMTRTPNRRVPQMSLKAVSWKAWLYERRLPSRWVFENYDQLKMAYNLIDFAAGIPVSDFGTAGDNGCPVIKRETTLSGVMRDFTITPGWSVGKALDSFGQRDGGYEWDIKCRDAGDGTHELYFETFEPGETRSSRPLLYLDSRDSTNRINIGQDVEDASESRSRVYALGDGQYPDQLVIPDEDPGLKGGQVLLRESDTTHSGVTQTGTLFDHAHSERLARSIITKSIPIDHPVDSPPITSYEAGDRARLYVSDAWDTLDVTGVRIIDRTINKDSGSPPTATVLLDMTDIKNEV